MCYHPTQMYEKFVSKGSLGFYVIFFKVSERVSFTAYAYFLYNVNVVLIFFEVWLYTSRFAWSRICLRYVTHIIPLYHVVTCIYCALIYLSNR